MKTKKNNTRKGKKGGLKGIHHNIDILMLKLHQILQKKFIVL